MSAFPTAHDDIAMDDSIDSESFRNASFDEARGQKRTHGSYLRSNASRSSSQQPSERSMTSSKLLSAFNPYSTGSDKQPMALASFNLEPSTSAPSEASASRVNGSGVAVRVLGGEAGYAPGFGSMQSSEFCPPPGCRAPSNSSLGRSMVSYEGSPFPLNKKVCSSMSDPTPPLQSFWGASEAYEHTNHRGSAGWYQADCDHDTAMPLKVGGAMSSAPAGFMQAHCRTQTPGPSENGVSSGARRCDGWGWERARSSNCRLYQPSGDCAPHTRFGNRTLPDEGTTSNTMTKDAQHDDDNMWQVRQRSFSQTTQECPSNQSHYEEIIPLETRGQVPKARKEQKDITEVSLCGGAQTSMNANIMQNDMAHSEMASHEALRQSNVERGLREIERSIEQRLTILDAKVGALRTETHGAITQNSMATMPAGGAPASSITLTDLDLRDLNKQVLKMNLREKINREKDLTDRLVRIEHGLAKKEVVPGSSMAVNGNVQAMQDFHWQLARQRGVIEALQAGLGQILPVRGDVAGIYEEMVGIQERLTNLETLALEVQQANTLDVQGNVYEDERLAEAEMASGRLYRHSGGVIREWEAQTPDLKSRYSSSQLCGNGWGSPVSSGGGWGQSRPSPPSAQGWGSPAPKHSTGWDSRSASCKSESHGLWGFSSEGGRGWDSMSEVSQERGWGTQQNKVTPEGWRPYYVSFTGHGHHGDMIFDGESLYDGDEELEKTHTTSPQGGPAWYKRFSGQRSFDVHSRARTVETIADEDAFQPSASGTQGSSWEVVSSRPRTATIKDSRSYSRDTVSRDYTMDPASQKAGHLPPPSSGAPTAGTSAYERHTSFGRGSDKAENGWGDRGWSSRCSSKGSRDHWRCPTTPSKWEGNGGRDAEPLAKWD